MRSLVTGGAGFIGSNLVRALLDEGGEVVVVDDFSTGRHEHLPKSPRLTVVESELSEFSGLAKIVGGCDYVFHLAAQVGVIQSTLDPIRDAQSNIMGTVRLLDACRDAQVQRIVCSASAAAFGEAIRLPVDEQHPQRPASYYALSKMAAEHYAVLSASLHRLPTVCLRYFNVFGLPAVKSEYSGVITTFVERLSRGEPLVVFGDGSQSRDFVYVGDVVAANLLAARLGRSGAVYNIGTGARTTVLDLAHILCELAGRSPDLEFRPARPAEVMHSVAAIDLARRELGYEPAYDLRSGLGEIWDDLWREARTGSASA